MADDFDPTTAVLDEEDFDVSSAVPVGDDEFDPASAVLDDVEQQNVPRGTRTAVLRDKLAKSISDIGLAPGLGDALTTAKDKELEKDEEGRWRSPIIAPIADEDEGIGSSIISGMTGALMSAAGRLGKQDTTLDPIIRGFQEREGYSDDEVKAAWQDLGNLNRQFEDDEKARVLSDGTLVPNPDDSDWLDPEKAEALISGSGASEQSKAAFRRNLPQIQANLATEKASNYEAAATAVNAGRLPAAMIGLPSGRMTPPSEWAQEKGRTDIGSPAFVRDYEKEVLGDASWIEQKSWGLTGRGITGGAKVANTLLGIAGLAGSDAAGELAAEGTEATAAINRGLPSTGLAGAVVEEAPSIATQIVTGRVLGAFGRAAATAGTFGTAGLQSAGLTFADEIAAGATEDEAREKAVKAGVATTLITAMFGTGAAGGVERVAAGEAAEGVTMRRVLDVAKERGVGATLKSPELRSFAADRIKAAGGEATEEGIDQLLNAFLTADPDDSLADAWSGAWEAFKVGGVVGGAVDVADQAARSLAVEAVPDAPAAAKAALETGEELSNEVVIPKPPTPSAPVPNVPVPAPAASTAAAATGDDLSTLTTDEETTPVAAPGAAETGELAGTAPVEGEAVASPEVAGDVPALTDETSQETQAPADLDPGSQGGGEAVSPDALQPEVAAAPVEGGTEGDQGGDSGVSDADVMRGVNEIADKVNDDIRRGVGRSSRSSEQYYEQIGDLIDPDLRLGDKRDLGMLYAMFKAGDLTAADFNKSHDEYRNQLDSLRGTPPKFRASDTGSNSDALVPTGASEGVAEEGATGVGQREDSVDTGTEPVPEEPVAKKEIEIASPGTIFGYSFDAIVRAQDKGSLNKTVPPVDHEKAAKQILSDAKKFGIPVAKEVVESYGLTLPGYVLKGDIFVPEESVQETAESEQVPAADVNETPSGEPQTPEQQVQDIEATAFEGQPPGIPPVEPPGYVGTPDGDHVSNMHAFIDDARARRGLPPLMSKPQLSDADAWSDALAAEQAHRQAGKPGRAGTDLFNRLLSEPPRALDKLEKALLLHELLFTEGAVDAAYHNLNNLPAEAPAETRKNAQAEAAAAQENYDLLTDYIRAVGTASGISLQAQKMIVNRDFTLARVVNERKAAKNLKSDKPVEWSAEDQKNAEEWYKKYQAAKARVDALEAANSEQATLIEQLTTDVEQAQKKADAAARQPALRQRIKAKLAPAAEAARARIEERRKKPPGGPDIEVMYSGPAPELIEDLRDYAIVLAEKLVDGTFDLAKATQLLVSELGEKFSEFGEWVFGEAQRVYRETVTSVSGDGAATPQEVVDAIDAEAPVDRSDVWALARAHVIAGARGEQVLDNVARDLSAIFPDLTREKVAELFTDYGKVAYPSQNETAKELQRVKSLERIGLKLKDVRAGKMPKRTGFQRGDQDVEVRELEKQFREEYRQLEERMRAQGIPFEDNERRLKSALGAVKRRMLNEIEEIERALASMTPRTEVVRTPVEPDAEAVNLRSRLEGLRQQYAETFGSGTTEEKKIAAVEKYLDRAIAEEEQMLRDGILAKIKGQPVTSPDIEAKRERLAQMRQHRRDLFAAANPQIPLDQAKKRTQDAIDRLQDLIARNDVRVTKRKQAITPDEELAALIDVREALADQVMEMRRALPLTPAQQAAKEKRMLEAAQRTLDAVQQKLDTNDLAVKAPTPAAVPWAVEQVRNQIKVLNKQLDLRRKEAKVGPYSDAAREARFLGSVKKRMDELQRQIREKDFKKKPAPVPVDSPAANQARFDLEKLVFEHAEAKMDYAYRSAPRGERILQKIKSIAAGQKLVTLGGDWGILLRNLGGATMVTAANDLLKLAPGSAGAKARARESQLLRLLKRGVEAAFSPVKENANYEKLVKRPNAGWDKTAGIKFASPFDAQTVNTEDLPAANLVEKWPWWVWPTVAAGGVALTAMNPALAAAVGMSWVKAAGLIGVAAFQKPLLQAIDRAQRAMTNEARAMLFDLYIDNAPAGVSVQDAQAFAHSIMVATGRGQARKAVGGILPTVEKMMPGMNAIALAPRYYLSRVLTLTMQPLYSGPMSRQTRAAIAANYAKAATVRGGMLMVLLLAFGKADDDDPEDTGVVLNPDSKDFLRVRISPTLKLDVMSGLNQWFTTGLRAVTGRVQDQKSGELKVYTPDEKGRDLMNFIGGKSNMLLRYTYETWKGEYFGGKPVTWGTALQEATSMIIIDDLAKIYEGNDPATATAVAALLLSGANVTAGDIETEKEKWAELRDMKEQQRRDRELELNQ